MGIPKIPEKALLFAGLLFRDREYLNRALMHLQRAFGNIVDESPVFEWSHSNYYVDELGTDIKRRFLIFGGIISPEKIADIKLTTNDIERELSVENKRTVNIDPGYITPSKVVLATTKNYCHRIYLGKGIYGEVTLYYKDGAFLPTPFTYNDYKSKHYTNFFKHARRFIL